MSVLFIHEGSTDHRVVTRSRCSISRCSPLKQLREKLNLGMDQSNRTCLNTFCEWKVKPRNG